MSGVQCPTTSEDPMDDAMDVGDGIIMKREADPLDDHNGQSAALYDAFWPVFLLRRGLRQGKALPAPKYRRRSKTHKTIEALCAASGSACPQPNAAELPSCAPISYLSLSCTKTAAAAVVANGEARKVRGGRAPKADS